MRVCGLRSADVTASQRHISHHNTHQKKQTLRLESDLETVSWFFESDDVWCMRFFAYLLSERRRRRDWGSNVRRGGGGFTVGRLEADGISESRCDSPTKRDALMPQPSSGLRIKTTCLGPLLHDPALAASLLHNTQKRSTFPEYISAFWII